MSFAAIAQLVKGQRPFFLYAFVNGSTETLFTSKRSAMTVSAPGIIGTSWTPSAVKHGKIADNTEAYRAELTLQFPLSDTFARTFLGGLSFRATRITIFKGYENDPDEELIVVYKGEVINVQPDENGTLRLICMTDLAKIQNRGLAAVIQRPCRHVLYGTKCGVDRTDFEVTDTVDSVSDAGRVLFVSAAGAAAANYYRGGVIDWDGRLEMILKHAGSVLTLAAPLTGIASSDTVKIYPGCDLTTTTCAGRFSNLDNHGGFPFILDSPFGGRSIV